MSNGMLTNFITCFNNHDVDGVMQKFCLEDTTTDPIAPCVGITDHGPGFRGTTEV